MLMNAKLQIGMRGQKSRRNPLRRQWCEMDSSAIAEEEEEVEKLHNVELNGLYFSPNIIRVIKSRRMRWVGM